jgi:hypothetical protein
MVWYKKVYRGAAFEHRIQASVGLSIALTAVVLPLAIYRIRQVANRNAPIIQDKDGEIIAAAIANRLSPKLSEKNLDLQALKVEQ